MKFVHIVNAHLVWKRTIDMWNGAKRRHDWYPIPVWQLNNIWPKNVYKHEQNTKRQI